MDKVSNIKVWYKTYFIKLRNNKKYIINKKGVFFQSVAKERSFIQFLAMMKLDSTLNIFDLGCGKGEKLFEFVKYGFHQINLFFISKLCPLLVVKVTLILKK